MFFRTLSPLIALDLAFIAIYIITLVLTRAGVIAEPPLILDVTEEWNIAGMILYLKLLAISVLLFMSMLRSRERMFGAFAIVFAILLLDDTMQFHEIGGEALIEVMRLHDAWSLTAQDLGELVVWCVTGAVCVALLTAGIYMGSQRARLLARYYLGAIVALGVAGIVFDMFHSALETIVGGDTVLAFAMGLAEDGGEMLVLSVLLAYAASTYSEADYYSTNR